MSNIVNSLSRGLRVLHRLSTVDGLSINEISKQLSIPRATAHRLVRTLESDGYIRQSSSDNRYRVTPFAETLGRSEDTESWVNDTALPLMQAFTQEHLWPVVLATPHGFQMILRATTDGSSPFALGRYRRGFLMSLTGSSTGLVYLSYCDDDVRDALIDYLMQISAEARQPSRESILDNISRIKDQGFARAPIQFQGESAIAIPFFFEGAFQGALALRYIARARRFEEMIDEKLEPLGDLSKEIEKAVDAAALSAGEP